MSIVPDLTIEFEDRPFEDAMRPSRGWAGFAVEHVTVNETEPYRYRWSGDMHYLALHDILLVDGGSQVDGMKPDATQDLRNSITFLPSGCAIEGWSMPAKRVNSFTALYFDPGLLRDDLELRYQEAPLQPILYAKNGSLQATMVKLSAIVSDPHVDDIYAESACIIAAFEALSLKQPEIAGMLSHRQFKAVFDYINGHLTDPISLSDLAAAANLSRYHFARAFKATTGQSPYAFVLHQRVEQASALLAAGNLSVEAVASLTGFSNTAQLRRYFRHLRGETPRSFQRKAR